MIVIRGTKKTIIGEDEILADCPGCEVHSFADIIICSVYFHLYWIPFVPIGKEVTMSCQKCGLERRDITFDSRVLHNHTDIKAKFRHPLFTYIGLGLFILLLVCLFVNAAVKK